MELRFVTSGQADLAVERMGAGPPLVFLHAGVADRRMWRAQLNAFSPMHLALAYDRRGFGATRYEPESHDHVQDLRAVLDAFHAEAPVLIGCSQGGRVAINFALRYPDRVSRLVLVASAISGAPEADLPDDIQPLSDSIEKAEAEGDLERVNALEARAWLDGPRQPEGRVQGAARKLFLEMNGKALTADSPGEAIDDTPDAFARLRELSHRTLVVECARDFPHVGRNARRIVADMPNSRLAQMDTAHLPSLEAPAEFNTLLAGFLRGE